MNIIILEEYKNNHKEEEEDIEDTTLIYRCDCGSTLFSIELSKKDNSGNRTITVVCSECGCDSTSCLDY